jgi:hypothetical protein
MNPMRMRSGRPIRLDARIWTRGILLHTPTQLRNHVVRLQLEILDHNYINSESIASFIPTSSEGKDFGRSQFKTWSCPSRQLREQWQCFDM